MGLVMLIEAPPFPRRRLDRRRARGRSPSVPPPNRLAANSRRYRLHKARGEKVYYLTANTERLINLLVRKGKLSDRDIHTHAMIELALAHWIDEEGRK
jgi:hypothetical protein